MRGFKKFTSTKIRQALEANGLLDVLESIRNNSPNRAFHVWQDRFDDLYLVDKQLLESKLTSGLALLSMN